MSRKSMTAVHITHAPANEWPGRDSGWRPRPKYRYISLEISPLSSAFSLSSSASGQQQLQLHDQILQVIYHDVSRLRFSVRSISFAARLNPFTESSVSFSDRSVSFSALISYIVSISALFLIELNFVHVFVKLTLVPLNLVRAIVVQTLIYSLQALAYSAQALARST